MEIEEKIRRDGNYVSVLLVGANVDAIEEAIQKTCHGFLSLMPHVAVKSRHGEFRFELLDGEVDDIMPLTSELGCRGYATSSWDGTKFLAVKNGEPYNGFLAKWQEPYSEFGMTGSVVVTDPSGAYILVEMQGGDDESLGLLNSLVAEHASPLVSNPLFPGRQDVVNVLAAFLGTPPMEKELEDLALDEPDEYDLTVALMSALNELKRNGYEPDPDLVPRWYARTAEMNDDTDDAFDDLGGEDNE